MKLYPKIDKRQFNYLKDLLLKKNKVSLRRMTQFILEIIEFLAYRPEFLNFDPLMEGLAEQGGAPYQQNLISIFENEEVRIIIITRSIRGAKLPKLFSFPIESIPYRSFVGDNQKLATYLQEKIEEHIGRISQVIVIDEKSIKRIIKRINFPKLHPILNVLYAFRNEIRAKNIIIPSILPEDILFLNYQDFILKFGELVGLKTRKAENIFSVPFKVIKIIAHGIKMGAFINLFKQIKNFF